MMNMMEQCWNWMMSFGLLGMLTGLALLIGLIWLIVWAVSKPGSKPKP